MKAVINRVRSVQQIGTCGFLHRSINSTNASGVFFSKNKSSLPGSSTRTFQPPNATTDAPVTLNFNRKRSAPATPRTPDTMLTQLRTLMASVDGGKGVHAFIVPTEDPHMSEYPPACFQRREWITKFTGSAGTAVVTSDKALLWTDGRYFLQAETELSQDWTLMKAGTPGCPDLEDWLAENLPTNGRVGIDPFCHTVDSVRRLQRKLEPVGKSVVPMLGENNLVDGVWGEARPKMPDTRVRVHALEWAGEEVGAKIEKLRSQMKTNKASALLVTTLDEVAWLTNLRGSDVPFNPVFISYAIITLDTAKLYVNSVKLSEEVCEGLRAAGVEVQPYEGVVRDVRELAEKGLSIWIDPSKVSQALYQAAIEGATTARGTKRSAEGIELHTDVPTPVKFVEMASPVVAAKALKNDAELAGMREAHLRDAVAVSEFLCWLDETIASGKTVTEVEIDEKLTGRRAQQAGFVEPSFPTIAGAGSNGAIIHYRAKAKNCKSADANTLLLVDSGCQYDCGTTDITRTMHFGTPSDHQKRCYTRVLQGHIAMDSIVFPEGTPGCAIDVLARMPLWKEGLNYRHGTGHGVGAALNVHEGPMSVSPRFYNTVPLEDRMIVSNEPGYYEEGAFGIRIENLVVVEERKTQFNFGGQKYFGFGALTLVPIQTKMIDMSVMTPEEVEWLDRYHAGVWESVSPRLAGNDKVLAWLRTHTRPLAEQLAAPQ